MHEYLQAEISKYNVHTRK